MVIERATCGHYAAFSVEGEVLHRCCDCAVVAQPKTASRSVPAIVSSRRKTSNSRGPGQEGAVYFEAHLTKCPKCGSARTGSGPHSPHYRNGVLVDCAGDEVTRG